MSTPPPLQENIRDSLLAAAQTRESLSSGVAPSLGANDFVSVLFRICAYCVSPSMRPFLS
jgi:hypothetical protein